MGTITLCLVLAVVVAVFFANYLTKRGLRWWGFASGLFVVTAAVVWGHIVLARDHRSLFSQTGPCTLCYEWIGLRFLLRWALGAFACVAYYALKAEPRPRLPPDLASHPSRLLAWLRRALIVLVIAAALIVAGTAWQYQAERARVVAALRQGRDVITGGRLREAGSMPLSWATVNPLSIEIDYVDRGGIRLSDDGRWLSLQFAEQVRLLRLPDMTTQHTFKVGYRNATVAFSPDSSMMALRTNRVLTVYTLSGGARVSWQSSLGSHANYDIKYSADGRELVLRTDSEVLCFDATTGAPQEEGGFTLPDSMHAAALSEHGDHVAVGKDQSVRVHERRGGRLVKELSLPSQVAERVNSYIGSSYSPLSFLPNDDLLFWDRGGCESDMSLLWDHETSSPLRVDMKVCGREYQWLAVSPDSRLGVFGYRGEGSVVDLATGVRIGTLPVDCAVTALSFTPDQRLLVVGTADGRLRFFTGDNTRP